MSQWLQLLLYGWVNVEKAGTEWSEESFVCGGCKQVNLKGLNIKWQVPHGLRCIDQKHCRVRTNSLPDFLNRLDRAGHVGAVQYSHESGVWL